MSTLPGSITLSSTSVFLPLLGTLSSWSHPTCPLLNLYLDREFLRRLGQRDLCSSWRARASVCGVCVGGSVCMKNGIIYQRPPTQGSLNSCEVPRWASGHLRTKMGEGPVASVRLSRAL